MFRGGCFGFLAWMQFLFPLPFVRCTSNALRFPIFCTPCSFHCGDMWHCVYDKGGRPRRICAQRTPSRFGHRLSIPRARHIRASKPTRTPVISNPKAYTTLCGSGARMAMVVVYRAQGTLVHGRRAGTFSRPAPGTMHRYTRIYVPLV